MEDSFLVETIEENEKTIKIYQDEYPESPREWDNLGTMVCFHNRYDLGDNNHGYNKDDFDSFESIREQIVKDHNPVAIVPIYMLDHSGISISHDPGSFRSADPNGWDWGQIGFAFVSRKDSSENWDQQSIDDALEILLAEIRTYNQFLCGDVYGYIIMDEKGDEIDSCCGIYGKENCIKEAKNSIA